MALRRFNYIQLVLYPIFAFAGIILLNAWLISLLDIDWVYLQVNAWLVNVIAVLIVIGISSCLGLFFYCYAQLMGLIVKGWTWDDYDKELQRIKDNEAK
jgi:hypothetical protein